MLTRCRHGSKPWSSRRSQGVTRSYTVSPRSVNAVSRCRPGLKPVYHGSPWCGHGSPRCSPGMSRCRPGLACCSPGLARCCPPSLLGFIFLTTTYMIFNVPFAYSNAGVVTDYYGSAKAEPWWCPGYASIATVCPRFQ